MADLSQEQLLGLASTARLSVPDEDVEHLTMRFNALLEALDVLDEYPLEEIPALPSLAHPFELPDHHRESRPTPVDTITPVGGGPCAAGGGAASGRSAGRGCQRPSALHSDVFDHF